MNALLKVISVAVVTISACFIYVAVMQPPQFSFLGMKFGRLDDRALAKRDDLERIETDLDGLSDDLSELVLAQKPVMDQIESMNEKYLSLSNDTTDNLENAVRGINKEISDLTARQDAIAEQINEINETYIDSISDIKTEIDKFTVSMLKNMPYVNMFPHELVAVMGVGARDPLKRIDENISFIRKNQPDLFNYPGLYVCPPPDSSQRTWNLVYGNYTTSAVADRIRLITAKIHRELKQRPAYPYPKAAYHDKPLDEACVDGNEWINLDKQKKIEIVCKLDKTSQGSPLHYCNNSEKN